MRMLSNNRLAFAIQAADLVQNNGIECTRRGEKRFIQMIAAFQAVLLWNIGHYFLHRSPPFSFKYKCFL
jgi:hypothetical protein